MIKNVPSAILTCDVASNNVPTGTYSSWCNSYTYQNGHLGAKCAIYNSQYLATKSLRTSASVYLDYSTKCNPDDRVEFYNNLQSDDQTAFLHCVPNRGIASSKNGKTIQEGKAKKSSSAKTTKSLKKPVNVGWTFFN